MVVIQETSAILVNESEFVSIRPFTEDIFKDFLFLFFFNIVMILNNHITQSVTATQHNILYWKRDVAIYSLPPSGQGGELPPD